MFRQLPFRMVKHRRDQASRHLGWREIFLLAQNSRELRYVVMVKLDEDGSDR